MTNKFLPLNFPKTGRLFAKKVILRIYKNKLKLQRRLFQRHKEKSKTKIIVMFHIGRSGSTVLGNLINQHPECHWEGELYSKPIKKLSLSNNISFNPIEYMREKINNKEKTCYGIEIKFFHLEWFNMDLTNFINEINMYDVSLIILKRQNVLRKIVSSQIAKENRKFHLKLNENYKIATTTIDVNSIKIDGKDNSLLGFLKQYKYEFNQLENVLKEENVLKLNYEEHIEHNPLIAYQKVCDFINIKSLQPKIQYKKTNPKKLSEIVINFDEVKTYLKDSEFSFMTDE